MKGLSADLIHGLRWAKEIEIVAASVRQLAEQMKTAKKSEELAEQYAKNFANGHHGITAASFRQNYGLAGAYLPGAQYPHLQQALPFAYGFGGGLPGLGNF